MRKHYKPHALTAFKMEIACDEIAIYELKYARNQATRVGKFKLAAAMDRTLKRKVHQVRHLNLAKGLVRGQSLSVMETRERKGGHEPDWELLSSHIKLLTGIVYPAGWLADHNGCLDTINFEAETHGKVLVGFNA